MERPSYGREIGGQWNFARHRWRQGKEQRSSSPAPTAPRLVTVVLTGARATVGRLPDVNDIALQPDPELLVTRAGHCTLERQGAVLVRRRRRQRQRHIPPSRRRRAPAADRADGASRRRRRLRPRLGRNRASGASSSSRSTQPVIRRRPAPCSRRKPRPSVCATTRTRRGSSSCSGGEKHEIHIRAQAHRLVRYMVERNAACGRRRPLSARTTS